MLSTEKVLTFIDEAQQLPDSELAEAIPFAAGAPTLVRGALATLGEQLPRDPGDLDQLLEQISGFCLSLRTDHEPAPAA